jgi:hypothetical protein
MIDPNLSCKDENRRDLVRTAPLFGLDYVEVSPAQTTLTVFFLGKAPARIDKRNITISGGTRIRNIQVTGIKLTRQTDPTLDDSMDVQVNQPGDFSTYTLSMVELDDQQDPTGNPMQGFDPLYNSVNFTFKASCPSVLDCKRRQVCPPVRRPQPEINYLAKDYASFRQLILDRMAVTIPNWTETHLPDIGIALVELLAYAGDYLSYYQDAVATEAYLSTARERISVRRHVRLIDYAMHEGCNARAWVTVWTDTDEQFDATQICFITAYPGAPANQVLQSLDLENVPASSYEVFQPLLPASGTISLFAAHSQILFYTWRDDRCCIAAGATSATLLDAWVEAPAGSAQPDASETDAPPGMVRALHLKAGDVLIIEEVVGPNTGNPSDADPTHRQAVRLIKVTRSVDALPSDSHPPLGQPIVEIEWAPEDALSFTACLSARMPPPACNILENITVLRGNVILVDHGANTQDPPATVPTDSVEAHCTTECHPAEVEITAGRFRPTLTQTGLTFSEPLSGGAWAASDLTVQDPREAIPAISLASIPAAPDCVSDPSSPSTCQVPPLFSFGDLADPTSLAKQLKQPSRAAFSFLYSRLSTSTKQLLNTYDGVSALPTALSSDLLADLNALLATWLPVSDLLESGPNGLQFVVEMDNDGYGHLRFGDGQLGRMPDAGMSFQANYRVGNGTAGNVGAETITYLVLRAGKLSGVKMKPRNPLAAAGGTAHEPISEVKLFAPYAFSDVIERAITADDYATLAADNARRQEIRPLLIESLGKCGSASSGPAQGKSAAICDAPFVQLQAAKATLRWTGGWYEALVAIDPDGSESASTELIEEMTAYLEPYRRIGHDLTVRPAVYVPLYLSINICVLPDYLRGDVEADLLGVLGNGVLPDGTKGFFNPDNLTFGEGIYVSQIVATAQAVAGVASVKVTVLERYQVVANPLAGATGDVPQFGVLTLGAFEIAQLDNDPSFPEHGKLVLNLRGGR